MGGMRHERRGAGQEEKEREDDVDMIRRAFMRAPDEAIHMEPDR